MSLRLFRRRRGGAIIKRIETGPEFSVYDVKIDNPYYITDSNLFNPVLFDNVSSLHSSYGYTYPVSNFPSIWTPIWLANKVWLDYKSKFPKNTVFFMIVSRFENGSTTSIGNSFILFFSHDTSDDSGIFTSDNSIGITLNNQINRLDNILEYPSEGSNILMIQMSCFPGTACYLYNNYTYKKFSFKYTLDDKSIVYIDDAKKKMLLGCYYRSPYFLGTYPIVIPLDNTKYHIILIKLEDSSTYYEFNILAPNNISTIGIASFQYAPIDSLLEVT